MKNMNTKQKTTIMLLVAATAASAAFAAEPATKAPDSQFKWGGDIRLREVYMDNVPNRAGGEAKGGANQFQRYRTRVWGEYHPEQYKNLYVRGRLVNEWRTSQAGDIAKRWGAFDETVFDNLFVDWKTTLWDIRVGRQDLIYGTGKLILDGTPLDGSRTIYFDAAKAVYKGIDNTTVDFLAMYTYAQDPLAIHSQDRSLNALHSGGYDKAEAGGGIYIKNKTHENLPWEAYFITKTKEEGLADQINTVGTRLMPKWADGTFDANLEMAYESTPGTDAFMVDALAKWHIGGMEDQKAFLGAGWYHLSEDWDPLFARWPQYSELFIYAFGPPDGIAQWGNVSMPHIDFSISPAKNYKTDLLLGYMFAPQNNSTTGGYNRGLLFTWWNRFTIKEHLFTDKDKLTAHLLLELMDPGDYYTGTQRDHTAIFTRAELSYSF